MSPLVFGLILFLILSAFFSISEFVAITANRVKLEHAQKEGDKQAQEILLVLKDMDRMIACILIGNNIANVGLSALTTLWISRMVSSHDFWSNQVPLLTALVATPALLMLGEIIPKNLGSRYADLLIRWLYRPLRFFLFIFSPALFLMTHLIQLINKVAGGGSENTSSMVSKEEFVHWIRQSVVGGTMKEDTEKMIHTTFEFRETTAREIMMPLLDVRLVALGTTVAEFLNFARKHKYTRYPVYEDRVDRMVGYVSIYDALREKNQLGTIQNLVHPIPFVPNSVPIDKLLFQMQSNRQKIVSVVDEYGGCDGIVTIEDIIEEVVGEIAEDHEEFEPLIQDDGDRRFRVDASIDIEDLNDELDLNLRKDGFDTLAGYLLKVFGRIPEVGEKVVSEDLEFEILQKEHLAIVEVRLKMLTVD